MNGWMDDAVVQVRRECEWEEPNTDVHAIDDYTMLHEMLPKSITRPLWGPLSGAVEAAGVQYLDRAYAWPGACRAAHPAQHRR